LPGAESGQAQTMTEASGEVTVTVGSANEYRHAVADLENIGLSIESAKAVGDWISNFWIKRNWDEGEAAVSGVEGASFNIVAPNVESHAAFKPDDRTGDRGRVVITAAN